MTRTSSTGGQLATSQPSGDGPIRIVIQPNGSLSPLAALVFFLTMLLVQLIIVTGFWLAMDAWFIVPFAGLELAALAAALLWCMRENRYREVVTINDGAIDVERGYSGPQHAWRAAVAWVRVVVEPPTQPRGKARLLLTASGKNCEIGRCLTEVEKVALAERLTGLVRRLSY